MTTTKLSPQIIDDLRYVFRHMPLPCLLHLRENSSRLVRRTFATADGRKCPFALMTEILASDQQITSRQTLTAFYGGDPEGEHYRPAKAIVRLWDDQGYDEFVQERYGNNQHLSARELLSVLDEVIAQRLTNSATARVADPIAQQSDRSNERFVPSLSSPANRPSTARPATQLPLMGKL